MADLSEKQNSFCPALWQNTTTPCPVVRPVMHDLPRAAFVSTLSDQMSLHPLRPFPLELVPLTNPLHSNDGARRHPIRTHDPSHSTHGSSNPTKPEPDVTTTAVPITTNMSNLPVHLTLLPLSLRPERHVRTPALCSAPHRRRPHRHGRTRNHGRHSPNSRSRR